MAPVVKYLGGAVHQSRSRGRPGGRAPFENIPIAKQREALAFIIEGVFAEDALAVPPAVLQKFGSNRWFHWGTNTTWNGRVDFPYHEQVLDIPVRDARRSCSIRSGWRGFATGRPSSAPTRWWPFPS